MPRFFTMSADLRSALRPVRRPDMAWRSVGSPAPRTAATHDDASRRPASTRRTPVAVTRAAMLVLLGGATGVWLIGCDSPIREAAEAQLRETVMTTSARQMGDAENRAIAIEREPSQMLDSFSPEVLTEIQRISGPESYLDSTVELGTSLVDEPFEETPLSLRSAVLSAVEHNLALQQVSINPAIAETDIIIAEARFDYIFTAGVDWSQLDAPSPVPVINGNATGTGVDASENLRFNTGLRKNLITGGVFEVNTSFTKSDNESPGASISPDPAYISQVQLSVSQPLLRGFGSKANLAEIRLNRNAHRSSIETFRSNLLQTVNDAEAAYWNLLLARQVLLIQERLLERGIQTRDRLVGRGVYDATPAEIALAKSRVETRRIQVRRARTNVLEQSDTLKQIINAPGLEVGGDEVLVPVEPLVDQTVVFSYFDAVQAALINRPEIRQSLLTIDDASIREMLADNLRLPRLDVAAQVRWNGLDDSEGEAYGSITEDDYVDYLLSLQFEYPIGNRAAEANFRQARLRRLQSVISYQQAVQRIVLDVKQALRQFRLRASLLQTTQDARLAAAESLRTIEVQEQVREGFTPEFLNLKFQREEALAQAEIEELQALIEYQIALANLYLVMGTGLERNQIEFIVPDVNERDLEPPSWVREGW